MGDCIITKGKDSGPGAADVVVNLPASNIDKAVALLSSVASSTPAGIDGAGVGTGFTLWMSSAQMTKLRKEYIEHAKALGELAANLKKDDKS